LVILQSRHQCWAIVYKFKSEQVISQNSNSISSGWTCTNDNSCCEFAATAGTIVKRVSLHNADQIEKLDIRIGDAVFC
jgi:DNA ligase (NAD+)